MISSREVPKWERRQVTVCIAAICEENTGDPKILLCSDSKLSGRLGSTRILKNRPLSRKGGWTCLMSGDDAELLTTLPILRSHFRKVGDIDETNVLKATREALNQRKVEKAEELIQGKFGISYPEFLATGKTRFPDDTFRNVMVEVELVQIDAEFVIGGFDSNGLPILVETHGTKAVIREEFAVCGEGSSLAQASLMSREHSGLHKFGLALYSVFEAKRLAERVPSVGDSTLLTVLHKNGDYEPLTWNGVKALDKHRETYGPKPLPEDLPIAPDSFLPRR